MRTKFFLLLAAILLGSASTFAQSGNIEPARGDVNGDGIVDVADINAVIQIMKEGGGAVTVGGYFYLGTTQPTATNYKTLSGVVSTYTSIDDATGTSVSVAAGKTLYMLCPAAWVKGKTMVLEDNTGNKFYFLDEIDDATISGYVIYRTQVWDASNSLVLKAYQNNYYVGLFDSTNDTITKSMLNAYSNGPLSSFTVPGRENDDQVQILVYPASWGDFSGRAGACKTNGFEANPFSNYTNEFNIVDLPGYNVLVADLSIEATITDIIW